MSDPVLEVMKWLRESTALDVKMELLGLLSDGTPLDEDDVRDVITEVTLTTVIYLVKHSTKLLVYLMRDAPYFPENDPEYLGQIVAEVPIKPPLNLIPDVHRRIAAAVYFTALRIYSANSILFSHVPKGKMPDWDKRDEGTRMEGCEEPD
jgi:hypothetical protein